MPGEVVQKRAIFESLKISNRIVMQKIIEHLPKSSRVLLRFGFDTAESEPSKMCSLFTSRLTSGAIAGITCRRERQVRIDEGNLESTKKYVRSEFGMR